MDSIPARACAPRPDHDDVCRCALSAGILLIPRRLFKATPSVCARGTIQHSVSSS
jgi:hypothetical protein